MTIHGDCFIKAVEVARSVAGELTGDDMIWVVQGIPLGTAGDAEGKHYWHAWVEVDHFTEFPDYGQVCIPEVIDRSNGRDVRLPREVYYRIGSIEKTWRFTLKQAREEMLKREHYGPWVDGWEEMGYA